MKKGKKELALLKTFQMPWLMEHMTFWEFQEYIQMITPEGKEILLCSAWGFIEGTRLIVPPQKGERRQEP